MCAKVNLLPCQGQSWSRRRFLSLRKKIIFREKYRCNFYTFVVRGIFISLQKQKRIKCLFDWRILKWSGCQQSSARVNDVCIRCSNIGRGYIWDGTIYWFKKLYLLLSLLCACLFLCACVFVCVCVRERVWVCKTYHVLCILYGCRYLINLRIQSINKEMETERCWSKNRKKKMKNGRA